MSVEGNFVEDNNYQLLLVYDEISNIISLENNFIKCVEILKSFDKKIIEMKYVGVSRIDLKKIFLIDTFSVNREIKLKELGI
jgi:hypothetical protein